MMVASSTAPFWLCFGISVAFWRSTSVAVAAAAPTQQQQPQDTCTPLTPTVAVAVQRSASADHSYVIAHAGCFGKSGGECDGGESVDSAAAAAAAAVCCHAMERAMRFLCSHAPTNTSTSAGRGEMIRHLFCWPIIPSVEDSELATMRLRPRGSIHVPRVSHRFQATLTRMSLALLERRMKCL